MRKGVVCLSLAVLVSSCSVYMEATRPDPTDLSQFDRGQSRDSVIDKLGAPVSTIAESNGVSCDMYQLYTSGYGAGGKIPIAVAEGAADVFTLGLAEVILTPAEGVTKNQKHPIGFCYRDQKLVRLSGENVPVFADSNPPVTAGSHALPQEAAGGWAPEGGVASPAAEPSATIATASSAPVPAAADPSAAAAGSPAPSPAAASTASVTTPAAAAQPSQTGAAATTAVSASK